jgi:hypothetical protein
MITLEFDGCIYFTYHPEYDGALAATSSSLYPAAEHFLLCDIPLMSGEGRLLTPETALSVEFLATK